MNPFKRAWKAVRGSRPHQGALTPATALDLAIAELRGAPSSYAKVALVLVDGRSGSGKTQFAHGLTKACPAVQVLHLDDLYPDWDGLEAGVTRARELVTSWSTGEPATYIPTAWPGTPSREPVTLDSWCSLIVEGVGARHCLPHPASEIAVLPLYLDLDARIRRSRALTRDGAAYEPYWDMWAAQEDELLRAYPVHRADPDVIIVAEENHA